MNPVAGQHAFPETVSIDRGANQIRFRSGRTATSIAEARHSALVRAGVRYARSVSRGPSGQGIKLDVSRPATPSLIASAASPSRNAWTPNGSRRFMTRAKNGGLSERLSRSGSARHDRQRTVDRSKVDSDRSASANMGEPHYVSSVQQKTFRISCGGFGHLVAGARFELTTFRL